MTKESYSLIEAYMKSCMSDSAHDTEHVYRVLYNALEIAESCDDVDYDILISACLLHDIARAEQLADSNICHALYGGDKAYRFLMENGFGEEFSERVRHCIQAHRYRSGNAPQTIEAKILFDADKLDAAGAVGIARTLAYKGAVGEPLYSVRADGSISDGAGDENPSFFQEYCCKLKNVYDRFFTAKGAAMAAQRKKAAEEFYSSLFDEVNGSRVRGRDFLGKLLE